MFGGRAEPAGVASDRADRARPRARGSAAIVDLRPTYERPAIQPFRRHRWRVLAVVSALGDLLAIAVALTAADLIVADRLDGALSSAAATPLGWIAPWCFGMAAAGLYDIRRIENPVEELRRVVYGASIGAAVAIVAAYSLGASLSRTWTALAWVFVLIAVATSRRVLRKTVHVLRRRGRLRRRALIVGTDATALTLARDVEKAPWEGLDVVGFVAPAGTAASALTEPVVGEIEGLRDLAVTLAVSDILVSPSVAGNGSLSAIVAALDGVPVELRVAPGLDGFLTTHLSVQPLGDRALVAIERTELRPMARVGKRLLDLSLGGVMLLLALPIIGIAALAVKIHSRGPAFFRQRRIGLRGRAFTIWKLRTMIVDAEQKLTEMVEGNGTDELLFKLREDPRVTRVGRFLRRSSIDELPQLLNVVMGQMSLVGPRPPLPDEVARYDEMLGRRLLVKPGITGLWQVSGRAELGVDEYVRHDLLYVQNWSFALDLYILAKTVPAVISGRGAY
jgi:exopolysaccharide biosynthesis polyprenyl glycosylphosphotransferase